MPRPACVKCGDDAPFEIVGLSVLCVPCMRESYRGDFRRAPDVDLRELLRKYIWHVGGCEGVSFLRDCDRDAGGQEFTDQEWAYLQEID